MNEKIRKAIQANPCTGDCSADETGDCYAGQWTVSSAPLRGHGPEVPRWRHPNRPLPR
jgi:hypothetical protein